MSFLNKQLLLVLSILCVFAVAGCTRDDTSNQILPMCLSADQQQIIDLVSTNVQQILLFEFNTTEPFNEVGVRLEVYEYGVLTETKLGFAKLGMDAPLDGSISVIIIENDGTFDWTVTLHDDGGFSSSRTTTAVKEGLNARAFGAMNEAVNIYDGTDAVIFVSRFTNDSSLTAGGDLQSYLNPDNFASYPLVHVLIANFVQ